MIELFIYFLTAYGITNIVVFGSIFKRFRRIFFNKYTKLIYELLSCPLCFSTWVGFVLGFILNKYNQTIPIELVYDNFPLYLTIFLNGCLTSGVVWLIFKLEDLMS